MEKNLKKQIKKELILSTIIYIILILFVFASVFNSVFYIINNGFTFVNVVAGLLSTAFTSFFAFKICLDALKYNKIKNQLQKLSKVGDAGASISTKENK